MNNLVNETVNINYFEDFLNQCQLFNDLQGVPHVTCTINHVLDTYPLRSDSFKKCIQHAYNVEYGAYMKGRDLLHVLQEMEIKAQFSGHAEEVFRRVGKKNKSIYVDFCDAARQVVEINAQGWNIISKPPVKFLRSVGMLPLPSPQPGGDIKRLQKYCRFSEAEFRLLVVYILFSYYIGVPHPMLVLISEQGSGKSTLCRMIRALIDPSISPIRSLPRSERDLMITALNSFLLVFDNLSHISHRDSDALCRLLTGSGFSTRQLFTDADEKIIQVIRSVILNAITDIITQQDLIDRCVFLHLSTLQNEERRTEERIWKEFEQDCPYILGTLFDALAHILRNMDKVQLDQVPRMADFAQFGTAAESFFGWESGSFVEAMMENKNNAMMNNALEDSLSLGIQQMMENHQSWIGTAEELLQELYKGIPENIVCQPHYPKSPQQLSPRIKRLIPCLRTVGIDIKPPLNPEYHQKSGRTLRLYRIQKIAVSPCVVVDNDSENEAA